MAQLLTEAGLPCTHEGYYTPDGPDPGVATPADSSWMAVPYLPQHDGRVILVVREPIDVVRSLLGIRFFEQEGPFQKFALGHEPDLANLPPTMACWEWWTRWNRRALPFADVVVFLDDDRWVKRVADVTALPEEALRSAAESIGTRVNSRARVGEFTARAPEAAESARTANALRDTMRAL